MALYTYDQFRTVLIKLNFEKVRSRKHETGVKSYLMELFSGSESVTNMEKIFLNGYFMRC
jgi:hypothetical protein